MAVVRRHWLQMMTIAVSLLCIGSLITLPLVWDSTPEAEASSAQLTEEELLEQWAVYEAKASRLKRLQGDLGLTHRDLAAMGLNQAQAQDVLQALLDWSEANRARVDAARVAERQARAQLRKAMRQVRIGPRDEAVIRSLPRLQEQVQQKQQQREAIQSRPRRRRWRTRGWTGRSVAGGRRSGARKADRRR